METLTVNNIKIDIVRKKIKNIHLSVHPPLGNVRVSAPEHTNKDMLRLFIVSKIGWIKQNRLKFENQERVSRREFISKENHYLLGKRYLLKVTEGSKKHNVKVTGKKYIELQIPLCTDTEKRRLIMDKWYRKQLSSILSLFIEKWEKILDVQVKEWYIKKMKTKWGSCNANDKRVWFNPELIKKSLPCIEYIVLHEMVHLIERNHNDRFVGHLNKHMPLWEKHRDELNNSPLYYHLP